MTGKMAKSWVIATLAGVLLVASVIYVGLPQSTGAVPTAANAPPAAAIPNALPAAQQELWQAITTLESRDSVTAKVRHEAHLFGQHLVGSGVYMEQRPGRDHKLRLELRLQLGDQPSSLVTVCDGRFLWEHRNLPSKVELSRTDVVRIMRALEKIDGGDPSAKPALLPGLGGLPRVLRGLESHFAFATMQRGQWGGQKAVFLRLEGGWKPATLARLLPNQAEAIAKGQADLSRLPAYLPDTAVVYLGETDRFPYRIEYRRRSAIKSEAPEDRALVTVDFYEVGINEPIDPAQFNYQPPSVTAFSDPTDSIIQSLKAGR